MLFLPRVVSVGAEELGDPAAPVEAQQPATEGKSWSLIILNLSLPKVLCFIVNLHCYLYKMVWALAKNLSVLCFLVTLVIHMLTCFLENLRMVLLVGLLLLLPTWVSFLLSIALVDAGLLMIQYCLNLTN